MAESRAEIAGLRTLVVAPDDPGALCVVLLHGYAMVPEDLAPFAHSMGVRARFLLPEGMVEAAPSGRAWWPLDHEARARALAAGPRDLCEEHPPGMPVARARLVAFLHEVRRRWGERTLALVGFSQGGMLACDVVLREGLPVAALGLLSSSRIAVDEWSPFVDRLHGLPALVSHGRADDDLAFAAGERLRDMLVDGGAEVSWVPFDQGHVIPLLVWRRLRAMLNRLG